MAKQSPKARKVLAAMKKLARVASGRAGTDTGSTTEVTGSMATFANLNTLPIAPLKCERDRYNAYLI